MESPKILWLKYKIRPLLNRFCVVIEIQKLVGSKRFKYIRKLPYFLFTQELNIWMPLPKLVPILINANMLAI